MRRYRKEERQIGLPEWLNIGNLATGIVIGLVGAVIGLRALRSQEEIAAKSGAFDKPALQVSLAGMLNLSGKYNIAVGSIFEPNSLTSFTLPLSVRSVGQRSIEDLYVQFKYSQFQKLMVDESFVTTTSNLLGSGSRKTDRVDPFEYSTFHFDKIHPGVQVEVGEPIILRETRIIDEFTSQTLDKKSLTVKLAVDYSYQIGVSVAAQDLKSKDYMLSVSGIRASSMDDLVRASVKSIEKNCVGSAPISFFDRITGAHRTIETNDLILLYPHRSLVSKSEGIAFFGAKVQVSDDVALLTYPAKDGSFAILRRPDGKTVVLPLRCR